ncbi:MAG: galactose mutarotase [Clostridia bacterium]|nr:galactose mutarotase [Clostridia bacterium]
MSVEVIRTGQHRDGRDIVLFDIEVPGMEMRMTNYGGIIMLLKVPDRNGELVDVVLGFDELEDYFTRSPYFGALVGRYANRIREGRFVLDGKSYQVPVNASGNALHGGLTGFDKKVMNWEVTGESSVRLTYVSPDGEEGFPGELRLEAEYALTPEHDLLLRYRAVTDQDTVVNLTNHSYFNLSGSGDILGHEVRINADQFTEVDGKGIPTGTLLDVAGTPMDFRERHTVGERIDSDYPQLAQFRGYDHNYALNGGEWAAEAYSPKTGILMKVRTTLPGMQFYASCTLGPLENAKGGARYDHYGAVCFETQFYPDSPNHENFPSAVLRAGETYEQETVYSFRTE